MVSYNRSRELVDTVMQQVRKKKKRKRTKKKKDEHDLQSETSCAPAAAPAKVTTNAEEWEQLCPRIISVVKYQMLAAAAKHGISKEMVTKLLTAIDLSGFKK